MLTGSRAHGRHGATVTHDANATSLPSGPLARLRAQLAGPRGYRRIDALLSPDDAPGAIAALSPNEVFELVHEVGFEDAQALIELATPAQIQGCFDLDGWNKDQLEVAPLKPWLTALIEAGFEKVGEVWGALDAELRALILQRQVIVYDTTLERRPRGGQRRADHADAGSVLPARAQGRRRHPAR